MNRTRTALAPLLAFALLAAPLASSSMAHDAGGVPHQHTEAGIVVTRPAAAPAPLATSSATAPLIVVAAVGLLLGATSLRRRSLGRLRPA